MANKTRTQLTTQFGTGQQASASKFEDLIDSAYNRSEDSVLAGPLGVTGTLGLWISATAPSGPVSSGSTGQTVVSIGVSGATSYMYVHTGSQWVRSQVETTF
jgi:hypothetical protein